MSEGYNSFPSFKEWSQQPFDTRQWETIETQSQRLQQTPENRWHDALQVLLRAAAVDTGAVEGLYETDRGFTMTLATHGAMWQAKAEAKGDEFVALFRAQYEAYQRVIDLATRATPLAEAWIRELHHVLCAPKPTYKAKTPLGYQEIELPLGVYKSQPNHVVLPEGRIHYYAPPEDTPSEMHRLCEALRSAEFVTAHPVLQASYAHYAFVLIHPFADGNGRVARALTSIYTYRSVSVPFLLLIEDRAAYLDSLKQADDGKWDVFVGFVQERVHDAITMAQESMLTAAAPNKNAESEALAKLYTTSGGFEHARVDEAGYALLTAIREELNKQVQELRATNQYLSSSITSQRINQLPSEKSLRLPVAGNQPNNFHLELRSILPAEATAALDLFIEVPKNSRRDDQFVIRNADNTDRFEVAVSEAIPHMTPALKVRITMAAERMLGHLLKDLNSRATSRLNDIGFP